MRVLVGGLIVGLILYFVPGLHSGPACLVTGLLASLLISWVGPRSVVEKTAILLTVALIAWIAGPLASRGQSLFLHLLGWTAASLALAFYTRPRAD
ncbi:MAG: hypothetical protein HY079_07170 [Elusimicrobia bacterium]|nr:hypothetical protein [Elusimicrobiota bacterium]